MPKASTGTSATASGSSAPTASAGLAAKCADSLDRRHQDLPALAHEVSHPGEADAVN